MTVPRFWRKQQSRYNLIGTTCSTCGQYFYPPRNFCPECRRDGKINEHKFKGTGKVVTYSIIRSASDQFSLLTPYVIAIIELDEGCRLTSQVICEIDAVYIGMPVKQTFRRLGTDGGSGAIFYGTKFIPA
ncbi:MAG: Zn-ribbon domain-containing OB-fold protein [Methanospirillaceae archaeon]|nr:Zn-ribbon domain-containing OB-fold protein [Methanospirillaceae archaeon]